MKAWLLSVLVVGLLARSGEASPFFLDPPKTVSLLDIPSYLGRWYQMYADLVVISTFERNAYCVTADYGLNPNKTLSVYNANTVGSPTGKLNDIRGYATVVNQSDPGKLSVKFPAVPVPGEYWVVRLGPKETNSVTAEPQYQYSVITDSRRATLFVLARDPAAFRARFQADVLAWLKSNHFDRFYNKPLETVQTPDCQYAPNGGKKE